MPPPPFKAKVAEYYGEWLANGIHEYTTAVCSQTDGIAAGIKVIRSKDQEKSCFKPDKPCSTVERFWKNKCSL